MPPALPGRKHGRCYQDLCAIRVETVHDASDMRIIIHETELKEFFMRASRVDPGKVDLDYLKEEFNRFRTEILGMKDKVSGNAAEALEQMNAYLNGSNLSSRLASLEAEFENLAGRAKNSGKVAVKKLESQVNERPIASVALAFGAGLLAAQFFRRN